MKRCSNCRYNIFIKYNVINGILTLVESLWIVFKSMWNWTVWDEVVPLECWYACWIILYCIGEYWNFGRCICPEYPIWVDLCLFYWAQNELYEHNLLFSLNKYAIILLLTSKFSGLHDWIPKNVFFQTKFSE